MWREFYYLCAAGTPNYDKMVGEGRALTVNIQYPAPTCPGLCMHTRRLEWRPMALLLISSARVTIPDCTSYAVRLPFALTIFVFGRFYAHVYL